MNHRAMEFINAKIVTVIDTYFTLSKAGGNEALLKALEEFVVAFGGCTKCYGKGYSTNFFGTTASPDFEGDSPYQSPVKTHIVTCECERGQSLAKLLKQLYNIDVA